MTLTSQGGCVLPSVCDTGGEKDFVFLFFFFFSQGKGACLTM